MPEKKLLVHEQVNNAVVRKHIRRRQESFAGCIRPVTAGGLVLSVSAQGLPTGAAAGHEPHIALP